VLAVLLGLTHGCAVSSMPAVVLVCCVCGAAVLVCCCVCGAAVFECCCVCGAAVFVCCRICGAAVFVVLVVVQLKPAHGCVVLSVLSAVLVLTVQLGLLSKIWRGGVREVQLLLGAREGGHASRFCCCACCCCCPCCPCC